MVITPIERAADGVYSFVRASIADGRLRPNEMLIEVEIADELGVSRSPVREALQRLVADGLVDLVRRRWVVHEFTEREVVEIYQTRAALEGYAAMLAATEISQVQKQELRIFRDSFEMHMQEGSESRVYRNNEFHNYVVECANSCRLKRYHDMNLAYHFNFNLAMLYTSADLQKSALQHIGLIDAIISGNGELARSITEKHVLDSLTLIQEKIYAKSNL